MSRHMIEPVSGELTGPESESTTTEPMVTPVPPDVNALAAKAVGELRAAYFAVIKAKRAAEEYYKATGLTPPTPYKWYAPWRAEDLNMFGCIRVDLFDIEKDIKARRDQEREPAEDFDNMTDQSITEFQMGGSDES